jgi:hypothetical protein
MAGKIRYGQIDLSDEFGRWWIHCFVPLRFILRALKRRRYADRAPGESYEKMHVV